MSAVRDVTGGLHRATAALTLTDPGRVRLRSATATTLSLVAALAVLGSWATATGRPLTVALLGTVVAMQTASSVKDRDHRDQLVTTVLMFLPAAGAVTVAAVLEPWGRAADVAFIALLFGAVWIRRFGPRGNALGMVAFISYFFGLFLRVRLDGLPELLFSIAVGVAAAFLVRAVVLPDRPRTEVRRLVRALRAGCAAALDAATDPRSTDIAVLRHRLERLGQTALLIDDWIDRHEAGRTLSVTSRELGLRVFEAQITTEQLCLSLWSVRGTAIWPQGLIDAVGAMWVCLADRPTAEHLAQARRTAVSATERADLADPAGIATVTGLRAVQAQLAIHHITEHALGADATPDPERSPTAPAPPAPGTGTDADEHERHDEHRHHDNQGGPHEHPDTHPDDHPDAPESDDPGRTRLAPSTRAAVQVAVATAAAAVLGDLISPDRWYWAVLTSFLVFVNVSTRGEILSRVGHRIVGTVAGVLAGVVLSALIGQHPVAQMIVLVACVFCAFYLVTVAYVWLSFFVTVLLAMLYGLLGDFSLHVLELRIAETVAGGAVGIASAYFVLATSTRGTLVTKVEDYLTQLSQILDMSLDAVLAPGSAVPEDLVSATRRLDTALQAVVDAARPLQLGPTTEGRHGVRRLLRGLQIGNRSAHALARTAVSTGRDDPASAPPDDVAEVLRSTAARAQDAIAVLRQTVIGERPGPPPSGTALLDDIAGTPSLRPGPARAAVRALNTLERAFTEVTSRV